MINNSIPELAVIGSFNEGKSSIVATLAEDDSVRVDPAAGETIKCQTYPLLTEDGKAINFIDTPGFQNAVSMLAWMKEYQGPCKDILTAFLREHKDNPTFKNECEIFSSVVRGARIIYVIDGSHPITDSALAEIEILRRTGIPRMAVINFKKRDTAFLKHLRLELLKNFNSIRQFNAFRANYADRMALLECFQRMDEDWQPEFPSALKAIKLDWDNRNKIAAKMLVLFIKTTLTTTVSIQTQGEEFENSEGDTLKLRYTNQIIAFEKIICKKIQALFRHTLNKHEIVYNRYLQEKSLIHEIQHVEEQSLKKLTFITKARSFIKQSKIPDPNQITIGPIKNIEFMLTLIDRTLLFYSSIINWSHGRTNWNPKMYSKPISEDLVEYSTKKWDNNDIKISSQFLKSIHGKNKKNLYIMNKNMHAVFKKYLDRISGFQHA